MRYNLPWSMASASLTKLLKGVGWSSVVSKYTTNERANMIINMSKTVFGLSLPVLSCSISKSALRLEDLESVELGDMVKIIEDYTAAQLRLPVYPVPEDYRDFHNSIVFAP